MAESRRILQLNADLRAIVGKATVPGREERYSSVADVDRRHRPASRLATGWRTPGHLALRTRPNDRPASMDRRGRDNCPLAMVIGGIVATVLYLRAEHLTAQANTRFDDVRHWPISCCSISTTRWVACPAPSMCAASSPTGARPISRRWLQFPGRLPTSLSRPPKGYARLGEVLGSPGSFTWVGPGSQAEPGGRREHAADDAGEAAGAQRHGRCARSVLLLRASIVSSVDFDAARAMSLRKRRASCVRVCLRATLRTCEAMLLALDQPEHPRQCARLAESHGRR